MKYVKAYVGLIGAILLLAGWTGQALSEELSPGSVSKQEEILFAEPVFGPPQEVPLIPALLPEEGWPGWEEFLAYRDALRWLGGIILAFMALLILVHLAIHGAHDVQPTGRAVKRYSWVEVIVHDVLALSFVAAWVSSTYLVLAKYVLGYAEKELPVPFGSFTSTVHIVSGLLFFGSLVWLAFLWRQGMHFASHDREWLKRLGGYFSRGHKILPAGKFNAGQKLWFYASILLGILLTVSGVLLYYPALLGVRWGIFLYAAHTALGIAASATIMVHVYLAVIVHPRTAQAMLTGKIDEACAREYHPLEPIPGPVERSR